MASQNVLQLPQQTGSADTSSVLYAVRGGNTDTGLPLTVLFNGANFTGTTLINTLSWTAVGGTGTIPVTNGGTGATTAAAARTNLGAAGLVSPVFTTPSATSSPSRTDSSNLLATTFFVQDRLLNPPAIGSGTPAGGAFTTLSATGLSTLSGGIAGVTNGSSAAAGTVGELMTSAGSAISLTNNVAANCTSLTLSAGDWDVWGYVYFSPGSGTSFSLVESSLNTTSATHATIPDLSQLSFTGTVNFGQSSIAPSRVFNVTTPTQVFLVATGGFSGGTATLAGRMYARRVR